MKRGTKFVTVHEVYAVIGGRNPVYVKATGGLVIPAGTRGLVVKSRRNGDVETCLDGYEYRTIPASEVPKLKQTGYERFSVVGAKSLRI